jgi:hypothetical protein
MDIVQKGLVKRRGGARMDAGRRKKVDVRCPTKGTMLPTYNLENFNPKKKVTSRSLTSERVK